MPISKNIKYLFFLPYVLCLFIGNLYAQKFTENFKITRFKIPVETAAQSIVEDSYGFIWIGTTNGLWRFDGSNFKNYIKNESDSTSITDNHISALYEDRQNTLWVGTYGGGLLKYNRNCDCFQRFIHDDDNDQSISFNEIKTIFETKNNQFYVGTDGGGLNLMNRETNTFTSFKHNVGDPTTISHNNVLEIEEIADGNIAVGTWVGLNIFDVKTQKFQRIFQQPKSEPEFYYSLEYFNGKLITTYRQFYIYDKERQFTKLNISAGYSQEVERQNDENCWFLSSGSIFITNSDLKVKQELNISTLFNLDKNFNPIRLHHSKKNNVTWLLDRYGSFFLIEKKVSPFKPLTANHFGGRISKTNDNFWVTKNNKVFIIDRKTRIPEQLNVEFVKIPHIATKGNNNVWIADEKYYYEFTTSGELIQKIPQESWANTIIQTSNDQLWVGEILGASNFDIKHKINTKFECDWNKPKGIGYFHRATKIFEDSHKNIWIGTAGDGLKKYVPETKEFIHYRYKIGDKSTLNSNFVKELFEDRDKNLWIGTNAGLCRFDKATNTFAQYQNPVLKDKIVQSIEQDANNNLWIGTLNGLIKYDYTNDKIRILNELDGLISHKIGLTSLALETGELVFNTDKGLMIFNPDKVTESNDPPKLYISKLWVDNEIATSNSRYISKNIEVEDVVNLNYNDKKFEFEFQVINYNNNGRCKFAYKLDGYDQSWIEVQNNQKATYTNIPSGNYTFMVKGRNEHGVWSNTIKKINVVIKPPFWELVWVKTLMFIAAIAFFILVLWLVIRKERNRSKFEIEKERVLQFEEVAKMKLKFFTNISHELRTPLTLITSPLDKFVQENVKPNNKVLEMMHRNSSRLLELVNQILDFRKLESNPKLQVSSQKDLTVFQNINASSIYWSKEKNINYSIELPSNTHTLYFDADVLEKIVTNLISNAFKYTPEGGKVNLSVSLKQLAKNPENKVVNGKMEIHVIDNGSGIPAAYQEKVFERFYKLDENPDFGYSSGIGLSLTAELVQLHSGTIQLKTSTEKGCHFIVEIPIGYDDYPNKPISQEDLIPEIDGDKTLVLIVEDNHDIRNYIKDELKENYQVVEAKNGKEGLQIAITTLPDVIISDIMMPESDGIQFANQLKSNDLTSHIPLLFLTAKTGVENKITGLSTGAEDYIQKPFNISEIKLKIKNVLESRNLLLKKFKLENKTDWAETNADHPDKYLDKVNLKIEEHLDNSNFSVEQLCKELAIGRSQLYRKLQALTGKSIIEYINFYKLSLAMQLIKEGNYTLKEISYKIGYNDNRYFSRSFKKEFGNPPSYYLPKKKVVK